MDGKALMRKLCQSTMVDGNAGSRLWSDDAWLVTEIRGLIPLAFQGRLADMTAINELFIEIITV